MIAIEFQEEADGSDSDLKLKGIAERLRSLAPHVAEHPYIYTRLLRIARTIEAGEEEQPKGDVDKEGEKAMRGVYAGLKE